MDVRFEDGKEQWKLTAAEARAMQNPLLHSVLRTLAAKASDPLDMYATHAIDGLKDVIEALPFAPKPKPGQAPREQAKAQEQRT